MKILIVYGTTEGHTQKVAEFCRTHLVDAGFETDVRDSRRRMNDLDISSYEVVILAGSVHQTHHQEHFSNFAIAHRGQLDQVATLLISVSLSVAFEEGAAEANRYVDDFVDYTGFKPDRVTLVAGALRFDQYDYYMSQIVEHVVLENRGKIDNDREFTDWDALASALDEFLTQATEKLPVD